LSLQARQAALSTAVARLLVQNNATEEQTAQEVQAIYSRVQQRVYVFLTATLLVIAATGLYLIRSNRRVFAEIAALAEERRDLARQLITAREATLRDISRELHDEFGQLLTAISLRLQVAKNSPEAAPASLDECAALVARAGERVRGLALELRPTMLESAGLDGTLRWLAELHSRQGPVAVTVSGRTADLPNDVAITAFRIAQEALTNVMRHARAREVRIELVQVDGSLRVSVQDDGVGFDVAATRKKAAAQGHLGLVGMKERAEILGGELDIVSPPGGGTRVSVSLPFNSARRAPISTG
jgi:signal transduction histidine kinase